MLGNYSRKDLDCQLRERKTEGELDSNSLQTSNPTSECFRCLKITNCRENCEITIETARMVNNEITTQVTRKLDGIREDLNTQILEIINSAITEKWLSSTKNVLRVQKLGLNTSRVHQSGRQDRSPEDQIILAIWTTGPWD